MDGCARVPRQAALCAHPIACAPKFYRTLWRLLAMWEALVPPLLLIVVIIVLLPCPPGLPSL